MKELIPGVKAVGVDPVGSQIALPSEENGPLRPWVMEGIGKPFIPRTCYRDLIDQWIKVDDKEAYNMCRRLTRDEGLLIGSSCGTAMCGALKLAKMVGPGKRIVVIFPDGVRNYMSRHPNDDWMREKGFLDE